MARGCQAIMHLPLADFEDTLAGPNKHFEALKVARHRSDVKTIGGGAEMLEDIRSNRSCSFHSIGKIETTAMPSYQQQFYCNIGMQFYGTLLMNFLLN